MAPTSFDIGRAGLDRDHRQCSIPYSVSRLHEAELRVVCCIISVRARVMKAKNVGKETIASEMHAMYDDMCQDTRSTEWAGRKQEVEEK